MPEIEIAFLSEVEVEALHNQVLDVYERAFTGPPYEKTYLDVSSFSTTLRRHLSRPGFRFVAASQVGIPGPVSLRGPANRRLIGFAYGYSSLPGQWWHDIVRGALRPEKAYLWMAAAFELAELAVLPQEQGHGWGGRLHDQLLAGLPHQTALLSTIQAETSAYQLYKKRGWLTLVENLYFPATPKPYRIMGRQLTSGQTQPAQTS